MRRPDATVSDRSVSGAARRAWPTALAALMLMAAMGWTRDQRYPLAGGSVNLRLDYDIPFLTLRGRMGPWRGCEGGALLVHFATDLGPVVWRVPMRRFGGYAIVYARRSLNPAPQDIAIERVEAVCTP
jgi:hypothetical protein